MDIHIHKKDGNVKRSAVKKTLTYRDREVTMPGIRYILEGDSSLFVFPWPTEVVPVPSFKPNTEYKKVNVFGMVDQTRKTVCYEASYKYSGVAHEVEKETPNEVQNIIDYSKAMYTEELSDQSYKTMCLANKYTSGYHCISAHSDNEDQFCDVRDVVCWVNYNGEGRRRLVFRNAKDSKVVLDVSIGNCIYVMSGEYFQRTFKHEIPRDYPTMFNNTLLPLVRADVGNDKLAAADWLVANREEVTQHLQNKHVKQFDLWCTERCSYTIRFFKPK